MPTLKPYPSYRQTDLPWLGQIPAHWDVTKVKRGYEIRLGKMLRPEPLSSSDTLEPYLRAANIQWQDVDTNDVKEMWFSQWEKSLYELREGDLMVCEGGDVGRAAIWQGQLEKCYIQNSVHRVRNREGFTNKFLYYWLVTLKGKGYIDLLCNKATIAHFTADKFSAVELIAPPLTEQQRIATYLDRQTAKIDALIAKKQRLLDLLAEQRAALISQAVTKGLNSNAKLKDSGVAWLGQVPSHWEVSRFRQVTNNIGDGIHATPQYVEDSEYYFINGNNLVNGAIQINDTAKCVSEEEYKKYHIGLDHNTVLISINGTIGNIACYNDEKIILGKSAAFLICKTEFLRDYLYYYLQSSLVLNYFSLEAIGTTIRNLSLKTLRNTPLPLPPDNEKMEIADYLNYQSKRLTELESKIETAIERLREYRAALISSVVTGKVKVI